MQSDNRAMRDAMVRGRPLIYFVGGGSGGYSAHYPVWIQAEDRARLEFAIAVDEAQLSVGSGVDTVRPSRQRLHEPVFRTQVLRAYDQSCAMCRLKHVDLLDAAHILPDSHVRGLPVVPNGLALCKIHHAAYDRNIIGIRPDLTVEVRSEILTEIDGPMLKHGLQAMNGERINVPRSRESKPDPDRLEERYAEFRASA